MRAAGPVGFVLAAALGVAPAPSALAQPAKVPKIGFLSIGSATAAAAPRTEAFRQGLRELGWLEGQSILIEYRWAEGKYERVPELAAELVRLGVDVVVAVGTPAALAAKQATQMIPIVMVTVGDPVASGLVASLARPGGNVTGLSILAPELSAKSLSLLREVVPRVTQVAVIWNPANPASVLQLKEVEAAAKSMGLRLQLLEARGPGDFDAAFAAISPASGALFVLPEGIFVTHRARLADLALKSRRPAMYWVRENVEAGGLMAYSVNLQDHYRRAAAVVDRILRGAKPADLPVEQPTKFELVINLKTAKALGLKIPQSVLVRADELIQ